MSFAARQGIFKIRFDYTQTPKPEYSEPKVDLSITVSAVTKETLGNDQTFAEVAIYDNNDNWYTFDHHAENYEDIIPHGPNFDEITYSDVMTNVSARQYAAILDSIDNIANLVSIVPLQKI